MHNDIKWNLHHLGIKYQDAIGIEFLMLVTPATSAGCSALAPGSCLCGTGALSATRRRVAGAGHTDAFK